MSNIAIIKPVFNLFARIILISIVLQFNGLSSYLPHQLFLNPLLLPTADS